MKNGNMNFYMFGDLGRYDEYNPDYVLNKKYVSEFIYVIGSNDEFSIDKNQILKILNIKENQLDDIILNLKLINAIDIKDNTYKVNFPIFLERDISILESSLGNIGEKIGEKIISLKEEIYSKLDKYKHECTNKRILYHIICDDILDGTAIDFFGNRDIFCISKEQPGDRDYIIVAYEESKKLHEYSDKLLCSSNNYETKDFIFNSFGDSNGIRKDVYRFFRKVDNSLKSATMYEDLNLSYIDINDKMNREFMNQCGEIMLRIYNGQIFYSSYTLEEKKLLCLLKEMEYIDINFIIDIISINIPIFQNFHSYMVEDISHIILSNILPIVIDFFCTFEKDSLNLTAIKHRVNIKEISNELWHQIFGATNEYLVEKCFVQAPEHIEGEGRYLKSLMCK